MKRTGNLFPLILERENLREATGKALLGKRRQRDARAFAADLETHLRELADGIRVETYPLGQSQQFVIHDPKERLITAPCFAERILHHAMMNVCEPTFERFLIDDSYACRKGKGRLKALERAQEYSRRFPFFLKLDMRKYFDSIDHETLLARLHRLFKDADLLRLLARIIHSHETAPGKGLPIGSLTSQHFANFYLGWFDRDVKERLRVKGYVRYMDDCLLWGDSTADLNRLARDCGEYLQTELQLSLKPVYLNRTEHGVDFLGCRVYRTHHVLNRRSRARFRRKFHLLNEQHETGELTELEYQERLTALVAFTRAGSVSSWQFRQRVIHSESVRSHRPRTG